MSIFGKTTDSKAPSPMREHAYTTLPFAISRFCRSIFLFFVLILCSPSGFSQSSLIATLDTFSPDKHGGEEFADAIRAVRNDIIKSESYDDIRRLDEYIDKIETYSFNSNFEIREAYTRHAKAINKYLGDLFQAEHYYLKAHHVLNSEELPNDIWVWHVENPLAVINNQLGDLDKSLYFYELAEQALLTQKDKNICRLLGNKGILYQSLLKGDKARNTFNKGIKMAQEFRYPLAEAMNRINLNALNILEKRFDEAKYQLDTLEPFLSNKEIKYKILDPYLDQLAAIAIHDNNYQNAINYYKNQLTQLDILYESPYRREYAKLYQKLAEAYIKADEPSNARQSIKKGIQCLLPKNTRLFVDRHDLYEENTFMDLYGTLAQLYAKEYDNTKQRIYLDSALLAYDYALLINDLLVAQFDTDESKYIAAHENNRKVDGLIEVLWKKQEEGAPVSDDHLINYLDESKSIVFDNALVRRSKFELLTNNQKKADSIYRLSLANLHHSPTFSTSERVKKRLDFNIKLTALYKNTELELDIINSPFINYIVSTDHVYAIDNILGQPRIVQLCLKSVWLSSQQKFLKLLISENQIHEVRHVAHELYKLLLAPIGDLPVEISIIPDGYLCHLPFDALIDDNGDWIIENHQIDYRLSMHTFDKSKKSTDQILCVTPDYGPINNLIAYNRNDLYPLKFAKLEETAIKESFKLVETRSTFNRGELPQILNNYSIFHYSGHARSDENYGSLILDADENTVSGAEIGHFNSNLNLAVLSACETGIGSIKEGEGNMSLARSFLSGGTGNVINSLWTVNDQTTAEIIKSFYALLKTNKNPALSLHNAKLNYLKQHTGDDAHPYYWAGLILTTTNFSTSTSYSYLIIVLLCSLTIFLLFRIKHKSS